MRERTRESGPEGYQEADGHRESWVSEAPADGAVDENRPADLVGQDTTPGDMTGTRFQPNKLSRQHVAMPVGHQDTPGQQLVQDEAGEE